MRRVVMAATLASSLLAACGGGLSEQDRTDFVAGCMSSGSSRSQCECAIDYFEDNGVKSPDDLTPQLQAEAATACAGA